MKKRLAMIVVAATAAAGAAGIVGGVSAGSVQHDAHCAALHARARSFQDAANGEPAGSPLKARYQHRANVLEAQAERCDARATTSSSSSSSTSSSTP